MKWQHRNKGLITGEILRKDEDWIWIMLEGDHRFDLFSAASKGTVVEDGQVMPFYAPFLTRID